MSTRCSNKTRKAGVCHLLYGQVSRSQIFQAMLIHDFSLAASSRRCCAKYAGNTTDESNDHSSLLCFHNRSNNSGRCFDPSLLVETKTRRCQDQCTSSPLQPLECIRPDAREQLLRITISESIVQDKTATDQLGNSSRVVLFQGSRKAVQMALTVSPYDFKFGSSIVPWRVYLFLCLIARYTLTLSLAMAVLNMLPLPSLDGDTFLQMILYDCFVHRSSQYSNIGPDTNDLQEEQDLEIHLSTLGARQAVANKRDASDLADQVHTFRGNRPDVPGESSATGALPNIHQYTNHEHGSFTLGLGAMYANVKTISQIHARIRWTTSILAVFVLGGSVLLHAVDAS